jgi:hypothetical protein
MKQEILIQGLFRDVQGWLKTEKGLLRAYPGLKG